MDLTTTVTEALSFFADPLFLFIVAAATTWGIIGGAMPGVSATLAITVALPFTFVMSAEHAIAALLAVLVGASYGNSLPAVVLGVPGTPAAVLTAQEGFLLHRRGEGSEALGVTYIASIVGQSVSIVLFVVLVVPLAGLSYLFLPPEVFALSVLGMSAVVGLTGRSVLKGVAAAALGIAISLVGRDPINYVPRLTFGLRELRDGLDVVVVVIGILAVSELIRSTRQVYSWRARSEGSALAFPTWNRIRSCLPAIGIGTFIGSVIGVLPGASSDAAAFLAYQQARLRSKEPEQFGRGSYDGIAANEAAQNACTAGDLIPTIAVGIPGGGTMVMILAAITIHGFIPGPLLLTQAPGLLHGAVAGLAAATLMLVVVGWPIARYTVWIARLDRSVITICAFGLVIVGTFILRQSYLDVVLVTIFGAVGYFMIRYGYSVAAAALGLILGDRVEASLRQGLLLSNSDVATMLTRPITGLVLLLSVAALAHGVVGEIRLRRSHSNSSKVDL